MRDLTNVDQPRAASSEAHFSLAQKSGRIALRPYVPLLREDNVRRGFFEAEQLGAVLAHLPAHVQPIVRFAYITGWRVASEILPLEWRNVDFKAGEIRLDAGTTKNEGRVFSMTLELRRLLEAQLAEHERLKKAKHIVPWVFVRMVAKGRRDPKEPKRIVEVPNVLARHSSSARSAARTLDAARLARGLPLGRDDPRASRRWLSSASSAI